MPNPRHHPARVYSQPQGPAAIDWGNPITEGLQRCWYCFNRNDLVNGLPYTYSATTVLQNDNRRASIMHAGNTAGRGRWTIATPQPAAGWTVAGVTIPINGTAENIIGFAQSAGSGTYDRCLGNSAVGGAGKVYQVKLFDGGSKFSGGISGENSTIQAGEYAAQIGRCTNGNSLQGGVNGKLDAATACANTGFTYSGTPVFGVEPSSTVLSDLGVAIALFWDRALTLAEMVEWMSAPFSVLQLPTRRTRVNVQAADDLMGAMWC